MDTVSTLKHLCHVVEKPALTATELDLALQQAGIAGAQVVPLAEPTHAGEPSHARFVAPPGLTLTAMKEAFGEPGPVPMMHGSSPAEVIFYPAASVSHSHRCALIAQHTNDAVQILTLRRDPPES